MAVSEEIKRYRGDRFRIASEICEVIMNILEQMEPTDKDRSVIEMRINIETEMFVLSTFVMEAKMTPKCSLPSLYI